MEIITSSSNKVVKLARSLKEKKGRELHGSFLVEGLKFVLEIPSSWNVTHLILSESCKTKENLCSGQFSAAPTFVVSDKIFNDISDVETSQGVIVVVEKRVFEIDSLFTNPNPIIFYLEEINDPGNLGTILRNCHAFGACGVVLTNDCVDIYSPKVVRASAGSIFHLPFVFGDLPSVLGKGVGIFATSPHSAVDIHQLDLSRGGIFALGNEARGLKNSTLTQAEFSVKIPIQAESLNVAICGAIFAYEAARQRLLNN